LHWRKIYLVTAILALGSVLCAELYWRHLSYRPTVVDDKNLWSVHRQRISDKPQTLAVLGASRIQLGFSPEVFHSLYPDWTLSNLTINANYPVAALADLADNTDFMGVVLMAVDARSLIHIFHDMQQPWVDYYQRDFGPGLWLHSRLATYKQSRLVTANPEFSIVSRLTAWMNGDPKPHVTYVIFDRLRFGKADYRQINAGYHRRIRSKETRKTFSKMLTPPADEWLESNQRLLHWIDRIQQRGGKVVLIRMPISQEPWEEDERTLPRRDYWDLLTGQEGVLSLHFKDSPELDSYSLPDGSHMDFRDKEAFTNDLLHQLMEFGYMPGSTRGSGKHQ
jgi:hypothetical protein